MRNQLKMILFKLILFLPCFPLFSQNTSNYEQWRYCWIDQNQPPTAPPLLINNQIQIHLYQQVVQSAPDIPTGIDAQYVLGKYPMPTGNSFYDFIRSDKVIWMVNLDLENSRRGWRTQKGLFMRESIQWLWIDTDDKKLRIWENYFDLQAMNLNREISDRIRRGIQSDYEQYLNNLTWAYNAKNQGDYQKSYDYSLKASEYKASFEKGEEQLIDLKKEDISRKSSFFRQAASSSVLTNNLMFKYSQAELMILRYAVRTLDNKQIRLRLSPMSKFQREQWAQITNH